MLVSVSFLTLLTLVVLLYLQQATFNQLNEQIPKELRTDSQDTDTLGKTAFAYSKLKAIESIYYGTPEYYKQYKYLLGLISDAGSFSIDKFSLSSKNTVELTLTSAKLSEVFNVISKFDSQDVKKYFSNLSIGSVLMKSERDKAGQNISMFSVSFTFEFIPAFNETNI